MGQQLFVGTSQVKCLQLATCKSSKLFEILDLRYNDNKSKREIDSNIDHNRVVMTSKWV